MLSQSDNHQLDEPDYSSKNSYSLQLWRNTIQVLLPVAALAVIWGRRGIFTRFILQFDKSCFSDLCPTWKDKQRLLKWANYYFPSWFYRKKSSSHAPIEYWKDGSLLCSIINSAIPGACSNPQRHWRHPPSHGQALAYKYLGITPVFSELELTFDCLTPQQEILLQNYTQQILQATKEVRTQDLKFSSQYIAKGMGLVSGEQSRKLYFYIYLNSSTSFTTNDIIINIRAPHNIYGTLSIPSQCIKSKMFQSSFSETKKHFAHQSNAKKSFFRSLSVDFGHFTALNHRQKNHNKIPLMFIMEKDRVKIVYIPQDVGIYEISIVTTGCHLLGSPFPVSISENTSGIVEKLNETDLSAKITTKKTIKRKIISEVIDFIDHTIFRDTLTLNDVKKHSCENTQTEPMLQDPIVEEHVDTSPICDDHIAYEVRTNYRSSMLSTISHMENINNEDEADILVGGHRDGTLNKNKLLQNVSEITRTESLENDDSTHDEEYNCNNNRISTATNTSVTTKSCTPNYSSKNSLNILNYLPQLKFDKSVSWTDLSDQHNIVNSLTAGDNENHYHFKDKLTFWERRIDINDKQSKKRRSLPNLQYTTLIYDELVGYSDKSAFKTRHNFWNFRSSQSINCVGMPHSSLSNVSSENVTFIDSFYFKTKFQECWNFWERLSSQNDSKEYLYTSQQQSEDLDSGFENSLPNSGITSRSNSPLRFDSSVFKTRRSYWENLSTHNLSNSAVDKLYKIGLKSNLLINSATGTTPKRVFLERKCDDSTMVEEITFTRNVESNLTDDLKSVSNTNNDTKDHAKTTFCKSKNFFRSLENCVK